MSSSSSSLLSTFLFLAMAAHSSATWCVCKEGVSESMLQKTLDYACGYGADCGPTHQNGPCFQPNTVKAHCSYAVNSFFQKKGQAPGTCDFSGTATVTTTDPSSSGCAYPTSASGGTPSTTSNSPAVITTTGDSLGGGVNSGGISQPDMNNGGGGRSSLLQMNSLLVPSITMLLISSAALRRAS
ncbi:unnamed protein product [Cuscuta campestris]|uniref:X8 domain-containing protein n=1 Tax=Cuscuta campestris TaxID=132261 RepID=A0A484LEW1_9ASTE|nr:unnamed protein product [Cuscuta campestris]